MKLPLKGIIPPVVTPLLDNNTLDVRGLERLIHHLLSGGVHGLFILGSTGSQTLLSMILLK
jgi:4-hydroxy-tetrahydrodipicolinate synthase